MGKTHVIDNYDGYGKKHPHAHGEDHGTVRDMVLRTETPPRSWGRRLYTYLCDMVRGNTPTLMGKTFRHRHRSNEFKKHPHAHGEDPLLQ